MKRLFFSLLTLILLLTWSSCRKDFDFEPSQGALEFSRDTVYLDTVFTNIGSSTYNLRVYNRSDRDISIPTVRLARGNGSNYRLNVDGMAGKEFENVELLANDSLFIFVETTIDINQQVGNPNEFLYTDAIEFDAGERLQKVELVTLVKDATFIFPNRDASTGIIETLIFDSDGDGEPDETNLEGRFLSDDELNFTNEKPYVIYGYAAVSEGKTLRVNAGTRVHFHANSGLLITREASLQVDGSLSTDLDALENEVIFEGDRLEPDFNEVPGQWGTIYLLNGSKDININYATIKNATIGILSEGNDSSENPKLRISNTQIYNSSNFGILGVGTSISAENLVINSAGQSAFAGTFGGNYSFTHSTLTNYWDNSFRQLPAVVVNNFFEDEEGAVFTNDLTEANFNNCIIYGNSSTEIAVSGEDDALLNYKFSNCLIQYRPNNNALELTDLTHFEGNVFNEDPEFKLPFENNMMIGDNSAAKGIGNSIFSSEVPFDILGTSRSSSFDAGAYQSVVFDEDED